VAVYLRLIALLLIAGALAAAATGASTPAQAVVVSAGAQGVAVAVPGQAPVVVAAATAPGPATSGIADAFTYPADGSVVRTGAISSSVSSRTTGDAGAQAVTDVIGVTLFNGEITAESIAARAKATAAGAEAAGSRVTNLVVLGAQVPAVPNQRLPLGDWGYLVTLEQVMEAPVADGTKNARGWVNALHVVLTADHGGLPAGSEIVVGRAEAAASTPVVAPPPPPVTTPPTTTATPRPGRPAGVPPKRDSKPEPLDPGLEPAKPGGVFRVPPPNVSAPLSPEGFVFPVFGDAGFGDTWHAPRATTGRHLGTDIFAPLGAPILAVTDGTLFSVGWNRIGGWRLWLRDRQGNQFYYAHLAAFALGVRDGLEVRAGQVIAFNGNTGDAQGTPFHLHFEFHPVGLLPLGYEDGAVNPYPYLAAWKRLDDISLAVGQGWAPPILPTAKAPKPAAVLLGSRDISAASGLDPNALDRAFTAPMEAGGDGAIEAG
jgi:murein DD-endopeptidase MepM/ murein hydrolase activator NlpD